jgi:hypothetical protein
MRFRDPRVEEGPIFGKDVDLGYDLWNRLAFPCSIQGHADELCQNLDFNRNVADVKLARLLSPASIY